TAAVSDFRPSESLSFKRKKSGKNETVTLEPTADILAEIGKRKKNHVLIGFCAETEDLEKNARSKLERKNLDFIVANQVGGNNDPFQSENNEVLILDASGNKESFGMQKKTDLSAKIWDYVLERKAEIAAIPARS